LGRMKAFTRGASTLEPSVRTDVCYFCTAAQRRS
jgi:hypothetical protein